MHIASLLDSDRLSLAVAPGSRVLIAVSGGADSVALLCACIAVASRLKIEIAAIHVNHGIRPEAIAEEQFVARLCAQFDVPCYVRRLGDDALKSIGGSAEGHWRALRYEQFAAVISEHNFDALALGHTAADLAETFLFHLARGTGVDGLTFQFESTQHGLRIIRPLWKTPRANIEAALRTAGQTWIEDPSNQNTRHRRNLIRRKIMPLLQEINPDATGAIVRASEAIAEMCSGSTSECLSGHENHQLFGGNSANKSRFLNFAPFLTGTSGRHDLSRALRKFTGLFNVTPTSRQTDQALQMISNNKVGLVSLSGSMTLVITQDFAWMIDQQEPRDDVLAYEHARRFYGFYADLGTLENQHKCRLVPAPNSTDETPILMAQIIGLDGREYQIHCLKTPDGALLRNRQRGERVGNSPLKKLLNESCIPWYLRDFVVFVAASDDKIIAAVSGNDSLVGAVKLAASSSCETFWD